VAIISISVYEFIGYLKDRIFIGEILGSALSRKPILLPEDYGGFLLFLQGNAGILIQIRSTPSFPHPLLCLVHYDFIVRPISCGTK
jgi:hypothetical protein